MLLALIAPRPLYVASATEDQWADPYGEQLATMLTAEIYNMYGKSVYVPYKEVIPNFPVRKGAAGYHLRIGSHDVTAYDWELYLDFMDKHLQ